MSHVQRSTIDNDIHALLSRDPLRHIMTLKVLSLYPSDAETKLLTSDSGWALRTLLPGSVSRYDRVAYPDEQFLLAIDGNDTELKRQLLQRSPQVPMILKTYDRELEQFARSHLAAEPVTSFLSFTTSASGYYKPDSSSDIKQSWELSDEVLDLFAGNGYELSELKTYIADGGCWFGLQKDGRIRSICLVYPNYEHIWEIAGVYTPVPERRNGYAKRVVTAGLRYLLSQDRIPRYAVKADNLPSIQLATELGLVEALRIKHLRIN
jgi:RimJ/RimL family protein N-acetyltransferase